MKNIVPDASILFSDISFKTPSYVIRPFLITAIILVSVFSLFAQIDDSDMPDDVAPPPLKIVSREEKDQLAAQVGVKDRAALYISLMEERLKKTEDYNTRESFSDALSQCGVYQGLLESMMEFLKGENKSNKALGGFKKLELTLRAHNIRLEIVRRGMPFKYAFHVLRLQKFIRRARAEASESLFSDSVVPAAVEKKP